MIRILLSKSASDALTAAGERAFTIIARASHPEDPSRWEIHIAPIEWDRAQDACRVLMGEMTATKPKRSGVRPTGQGASLGPELRDRPAR
jgi:hypothetical protein